MVTAALYSYGLHRPQGDAPPPAPTIAEWKTLPPDAPFTYKVTEIFAGDPQARDLQNEVPPLVKPLAINNAAQVVGEVCQPPETAPAWVRRLLNLPYLSYFNHLKYPNTAQTAFFGIRAAPTPCRTLFSFLKAAHRTATSAAIC